MLLFPDVLRHPLPYNAVSEWGGEVKFNLEMKRRRNTVWGDAGMKGKPLI